VVEYASLPVETWNGSFTVVEGFIDSVTAGCLDAMLLLRAWRNEGRHDEQVPSAYSYWGDSTLDGFLIGLQPKVERVTGRPLLPTYAYARLYRSGDALERHRDRAACEIAVTVHLGHRGSEPPPICFAPDVEVHQRPGDAVVYRGDRLEHWRDRFDGDSFGQLFLNFVFADGDRTSLLFDERHGAFPPLMRPPAIAVA
jgi:hypothetical protein